MKKKVYKYLKIRENTGRYGSETKLELCEEMDEEDCEYLKLVRKKK